MTPARTQVTSDARARPVRTFVRTVPGALSLAAAAYVGLMLPVEVAELFGLIPLCAGLLVLVCARASSPSAAEN